MSGHSHAKTVKRVKDANDALKGKIFSKISREITISVKEGGSDPESNSKLRMIMQKARKFNMPKDGVEKAIKKGTGELASETLESVTFEILGPKGIAIIVEGITDNKNRTLGEIKGILSQTNGKLADEGATKWLFERKGEIVFHISEQAEGKKDKEEIELAAIESGAGDVYWDEDIFGIYTKPEDLEKVKKAMEEGGFAPESVSLIWKAKNEITLDEKGVESCQKLFDQLDENDAVQGIYSNLKI
ncbi:transcriptional regulator [Candidatus Parcubacteria bacterium A4]|nr:MAG: transcriptional regulator [Candidatus Parcubacteria bacterium A4]